MKLTVIPISIQLSREKEIKGFLVAGFPEPPCLQFYH